MRNRVAYVLSGIIALSVVLTFFSAGLAQSGRRVKKPTTVPATVPESTPVAVKPAAKSQPAYTFVVGFDRYSDYRGSRLSPWVDILGSCAERLDDNLTVKVEPVRANMTHSDAVTRAKNSKEAYVVWLNLDLEYPTRGTDGYWYIKYRVFSPTTAKIKTSGQTYPQAHRRGGVIINPRTRGSYGDYQLQEAAREAAERILSAFNLQVPDRGILRQSSLLPQRARR